jgi:prepilin-type N-terminal cleavage/methylation domain-containing protein
MKTIYVAKKFICILRKMKKAGGITLIELLVVIAIIGILVIALGFSFEGWVARYRVEAQMKELYSDLMNAKMRALTTKRQQCVNLAAAQYTVVEDSTGNGSCADVGDTTIITRDLVTGYTITWVPGTAAKNFDVKGFASSASIGAICSNTVFDADYSCIVIAQTRINIGRLGTLIPNGGLCDAVNCVGR